MQIERVRPAVFQITLHAYQLATLVAAARVVALGAEAELNAEARGQLQTVLADYDEAFRRAKTA
jgi:hypothetical protein